jgi:DNA-binding Lrp family transcriptional regulator
MHFAIEFSIFFSVSSDLRCVPDEYNTKCARIAQNEHRNRSNGRYRSGIDRRDGRACLSDLAARLNLSRATVRLRMERLETRGEVVGFTVLTRTDVKESPVRGQMMIGIEGRGQDRIVARLLGLPSVKAVHSTNGKWDLIAELATLTLLELHEVIHKIRSLEGVTTSETNLFLSTRKAGRRQ